MWGEIESELSRECDKANRQISERMLDKTRSRIATVEGHSKAGASYILYYYLGIPSTWEIPTLSGTAHREERCYEQIRKFENGILVSAVVRTWEIDGTKRDITQASYERPGQEGRRDIKNADDYVI